MVKISWTCVQCGMWHSVPSDSHLKSEHSTYDGLPIARAVLHGLAELLLQKVPPDSVIVIESYPMGFKPSWLSEYQRTAKNLRWMRLSVRADQPFSLFCEFCGHDSTAELPAEKEEILMKGIERRKSNG